MQVGTRIQIGHERATVRYMGPVQGTAGEWLGIEWDDPKRGKHQGVHKGTRYFDCKYTTSGSFIRNNPEKIMTGRDFFTALKERYTLEDTLTTLSQDYDESKDRGELYIGDEKQIKVETFGFEKILRAQRQLSGLKVVGLAEQWIVSAGDVDAIVKANLIIQDLDLSRNLLFEWKTVSVIVQQLPCLEILRLNQLRLDTPPTQGLCFSHLKTLSLNETLITWKDITLLAPQLPLLEDLQLGGNNMSTLDTVTGFEKLRILNLEHNSLVDWSEIKKLGSLPNLEILFLNNNGLAQIQAPDGLFQKLESLNVNHNAIGDWRSVDALNQFSRLKKLRCKHNPILKDMLIELQIIQLVGRIGSLTEVNGNTLTNRERVDSERFYLKSCVKDETTHEAIAAIHPRYTQLCKLHGEPDLQVQAKESTTLLKDRLINITLTRRNTSLEVLLTASSVQDLPPTEASVPKRFLPTMTIRNMKNIIQRLLKIPAAKQQLVLLQSMDATTDRDVIAMDINDNLRDLKFYSMNDGDEIVVLEI